LDRLIPKVLKSKGMDSEKPDDWMEATTGDGQNLIQRRPTEEGNGTKK
jgi:hypothetical protein